MDDPARILRDLNRLLFCLLIFVVLVCGFGCVVPDLFGPRPYSRWRTDPPAVNTPRIVATCEIGIGAPIPTETPEAR